MADPRAEARRRGWVPRAPAFTGAGAVIGGLAGTAAGAALAPWETLVQAAFRGTAGKPDLDAALDVAVPVAGGAAVGALLGLLLAQIALGAWAPALRLRWRRPAPPRRLAALLFVGAVGALAALPWVLARVGPDPGRLLLWTPAAAVLGGAVAMLPVLLLERAAARRRWHRRVHPWPPPRRAPDELPPEARAAIRARRAAGS